MKIKGISFFEQHVEKLVLGVAVLLFLGFAGWQLLHQPNLVQVGREEVGPGAINDILEEKANEKQARLATNAASPIQLADPVRAARLFEERLDGDVSPVDRLAQVTPGLSPRLEIVEQADKQFIEPDIPGPTEVVAQGYSDGLTDDVVNRYRDRSYPDGFQGVLNFQAGEPADIFWVSVLSVFDMSPVLDQLAAGGTGPDGEALAPVPRTFYGSGLEIFGVEVQREEKVDGVWTGLTTLDPIPGQQTVLDQLPDNVDAATRDEWRMRLAQESFREDVLRPDFYATKNGSWSPPRVIEETTAEPGEMTEEGRRERALRRQIPVVQAKVAELRDRVNTLAEEIGEDPPPASPPAGGGGGGGNEGGPSGSGNQLGSGSGGGGSRGKRDNDRLQLKAKLESLKEDLAQRERQLDRLQREFEALAGERLEDQAAERAAEAEANKSLSTIWAHDITAVPGQTYRYRMRVRIYNPFFARKLNLMPSQAHLADELTLASEFSDWSNPVKVPTPLEFFVTEASVSSGIGSQGGPQANFEVYRFYDGVWRQAEFTARPGDRIGDLRRPRRNQTGPTIDYSTSWFVLDIIEDPARGASVLLQNIETGEVSPLRDPRVEQASAQRDLLELEASEAAVSGGAPGAPAAP